VLWYAPCPMNAAAVEGAEDMDGFYAALQEALDLPLAGDPRDFILEPGWFYDTNFHPNTAGKTVYTRALIRAVKAMLGDSSPTDIPLPEMPPLAGEEAGEGDSSDSGCFVCRERDGVLTVTGLTGEGLGRTALTVPALWEGRPVAAIAPGAFAGAEGLREKRDFLTEAAFRRYQDRGLSAAVARALYGLELENSVTRLETYAACAYRHFLQYGLTLQERKEFSFEYVDMGNVYHAVLEQFAEKLKEKGYTWFDFPEDFAGECVKEALERCAADYGSTVLYRSARNEYAVTRMGRILTRTVLTLQKQLQKGSFVPESFELSFHYADNLESVNVALSEREKMRLRGRIDRIDVAEDEKNVYVKVIDYKSGHKKFDLAALYYGLQLQLVVYMNAAAEVETKRHRGKEIVPAALLYYRIDDPSVETAVELTPEEINEEIGKKLRMNGVVNSAPGIVELLDKDMGDKSDVIPVERKKDGSFSARSSVLDGEELKTVSDYVSRKIAEIGREILDGTISLNPYEKGPEEACTYCAYKKVCGFEPAMPGCARRKLEDMDREEALRRMAET